MNTKASNNRRNFLKQGLVGAAGLTIAGGSIKAAVSNIETPSKIIKRKLGNTGIELPVLSLGKTGSKAVVQGAVKAGIAHFDTAYRYDNGNHEILLGESLKEFDRKSYTIVTRLGISIDKENGYVSEEDKKEFFTMLDTSMKRLQTDYVDILYLHGLSAKAQVFSKDAQELLAKAKQIGKAKHVGFSTHRNEVEVINAAAEDGFFEVILTSYNFKKPDLEAMNSAIQKAADKGIGIISMKNAAGAYWDKEKKHPINVIAALKWVLQNENVCTVIPRMDNLEYLMENIQLLENIEMTPEEKDDLKLGEKLGLAGLYCSQCGECIPVCKNGWDIPTAMRSYMYAFGYSQLKESKETLEMSQVPINPCDDCDICPIKCTMGFDVAQKMTDISRIREIPDEFIV